jgi:hypothetical protein
MVKRKPGEKEIIAEALAFIKAVKQKAPSENKIIGSFLEEKERALHEELFNAFFEKVEDQKKD